MLSTPHLPCGTVFLSGLALVVSLGCQGEGAPSADPSPTPSVGPGQTQTPTPAPSPTPAAVEWHRVAYGTLCPEGQGLDIDGDGSPDNGIYAAIPLLQAWMIETLEAALQQQVMEGELTPAQADALLEQMTQLVYEWITIENLVCLFTSCGGSEQLESNLGLQLEHRAQAADLLSFWGADMKEGGDILVPEVRWGTLPGEMDPSRQGMFGPGELRLETDITLPGSSSSQEVSVTARDCRALLNWSTPPASLMVGGGITLVDMAQVAEHLLYVIAELFGITSPIIVEMEQLESALLAASDITCSSGEPCYSVCYYMESSPTAVDVSFSRPASTP